MPATLDDILAVLQDGLMEVVVDLLTPKPIAEEFNKTITGGSPFGSVSPSNPNSGFRISVAADTAGTFSIVRNKSSSPQTTVTTPLNGGNLLTANAEYIFDILANSDEQISFQYSANAKFLIFKVFEIRAMTV